MTRTAIGSLLLLATSAAAAPPTRAEIAKATKPAVALIVADTRYVSAVCVSSGGYFVAPSWAVEDTGIGRPVRLVRNAGGTDEAVLIGRTVRIDADAGLALVRVQSEDPLPAVALGDDAGVQEGDELIAVGYPHPKPDIKTGKWEYAPCAAGKRKIRLRSEQDGRLHRLHTEEPENPFAGGPVLDLTGKVIGLSAVDASRVSRHLVIPVSALRTFLSKPEVTVTAAAVDTAKKHEKLTVRVELFSVPAGTDTQTVELFVRSDGAERRVEMKLKPGGGYEAAVAPFVKFDGPPPIRLEVIYPDGSVRGQTPDRKFRVGEKEYALGKVAGVRFGKPASVRLPDGTTAEGELSGLDDAAVTLGGKPLAVGATARELVILPPEEPAGGFRLTVVVRREGKEVARASALRFLTGSEPFGIDGMRLGLLTRPPAAQKAGTSAVVAGTDGEHYYGGRMHRFDAKRVRVSGARPEQDSAVTVELHSPHPKFQTPLAVSVFTPGLVLGVRPPKGKLLGEREYPIAVPHERLGFGSEAAGVRLSVEGIEVPATYGRFAVWELEVADGGKQVTRLALDAILYPESQSDTPVFVTVRFNSKYK